VYVAHVANSGSEAGTELCTYSTVHLSRTFAEEKCNCPLMPLLRIVSTVYEDRHKLLNIFIWMEFQTCRSWLVWYVVTLPLHLRWQNYKTPRYNRTRNIIAALFNHCLVPSLKPTSAHCIGSKGRFKPTLENFLLCSLQETIEVIPCSHLFPCCVN
jgi:hypothetical protein